MNWVAAIFAVAMSISAQDVQAQAAQPSLPPGYTPNWVATPLVATPAIRSRISPLRSQASSTAPVKIYYDTSLTSCPSGEKLGYFYHWQDVPDFRGADWCAAAAADIDWANRTDPNRWRIPYVLESCQPGVAWTYSHAFPDGSRYHSGGIRDINMVCEAIPEIPLGCASGGGLFSNCSADNPDPVAAGLPASGTPVGGGLGPNAGAPGAAFQDPTIQPRARGSSPLRFMIQADAGGGGGGGGGFDLGDSGAWDSSGWDDATDWDATGDDSDVADGGDYPDDESEPSSDDDLSDGEACASVESQGNPIAAATGNKYQRETDYSAPRGPRLVRHYNSSLPGWTHNYGVRVLANATKATVIRPDGRALAFTGAGLGRWSSDNAAVERLYKVAPSDSYGATWKFHAGNEATEWYDASGRLISIVRRGGITFSAQHADGLLRSVTDSFGRSLQFGYDTQNRLVRVTTPDGTAIDYAYGAGGQLAQVIYPDGTRRQYLYESPAFPLALTGIIDQRGVRYATWTYDGQGRAVSAEHAGGANRYALDFLADGGVRIVDPLGTARTHHYASVSGRKVFMGLSQPCEGCTGESARNTIDAATGSLLEQIDYLGVATMFTQDTGRQLPISITHAAGRPEQRQTHVQWHPTLRLPTLVTRPGRSTAYSYDETGRLQSATATDLQTGETRTRSWTYNAAGLRESMTDPRGATWRYAYDNAGNRTAVVNPLGQMTKFAYDAAGRVTVTTYPDGLVRRNAYDPMGRLVRRERGSEVISYGYTPVGLLESVSLPSGYRVTYSYDDAHRLIGASDNRGESVAFTLDGLGNRTRVDVRNASGSIALVTGRVINSLNRVAAVQGASGQTTQFGYDGNGRLVSLTDPLNHTTRRTLDALGRHTTTVLQDNSTASYAWNQQSQLTQVVDLKGVATRYSSSAFGEVLSEASGDVGTFRYGSDRGGKVILATDSKGQTTQVERDALGRPVRIVHAPDHEVRLAYDLAGRVAQVDDKSGATSYERDAERRLVGKLQLVKDGSSTRRSYPVRYEYSGGDLVGVTYPSGLKVSYRRVAGRIVGVDVQPRTANRSTFMSELSFTALGVPTGWKWMNGDSAFRMFDADGRLTKSELASYGYDSAGRVNSITQELWASRTGQGSDSYRVPLTWLVGYDSQNRVVSFARDGAAARYTYDANGNRLTAVEGVTSGVDLEGVLEGENRSRTLRQDLVIDAQSNKLLGYRQTTEVAVNGRKQSEATSAAAYSVDENGSLTSDGLRTFKYDESRRLVKVRILKSGEAAFVSYLHNAMGHRVFKGEPEFEQSEPREDVLGRGFVDWLRTNFGWLFGPARAKNGLGKAFVHADGPLPSWALLGEYDDGGATAPRVIEYIWLPTAGGNAILVGLFRDGAFYAVHPDHLGTPRLVTNTDNTVVWQWPYSAFGNNRPVGALRTTAVGNRSSVGGTPPDVELNMRFPGQYFDEESGLIHNHARSYQASHGRYVQADPIGITGGLHRFAYVNSSPLSYIDPNGLDAIVCLYPGASGAGHVGIGINSLATSGLYPRSESPGFSAITGTPGAIRPDVKQAESCMAISATAEQDRRMSEVIARTTENPGMYTLIGNNCTNFVRSVLQEAGIATSGSIGPRPYFDNLLRSIR